MYDIFSDLHDLTSDSSLPLSGAALKVAAAAAIVAIVGMRQSHI